MIRKAILAAAGLSLLVSCGPSRQKGTEQAQAEKIPVRIQVLQSRPVAKTLEYTANLQADEQVYYAPAATGRISKIYVEVGDKIQKGQLLVDMDRTQLVQAEVQLENLKTEYNRAKTLKETNSISQQAYDQAVTQYEVTKANVDFLKENTGYEIVVLYEGEEHQVKLLQLDEDLKYIIVVPNTSMIPRLKLPDAPCLFATIDFEGEDEPEIHFYTQEDVANE